MLDMPAALSSRIANRPILHHDAGSETRAMDPSVPKTDDGRTSRTDKLVRQLSSSSVHVCCFLSSFQTGNEKKSSNPSLKLTCHGNNETLRQLPQPQSVRSERRW